MRERVIWVPTRSNMNRAVQSQMIARSFKFWLKEEEGLYYPCSENKGTDQPCGYREAGLRHCFRICRLFVFLCSGSFNKIINNDCILAIMQTVSLEITFKRKKNAFNVLCLNICKYHIFMYTQCESNLIIHSSQLRSEANFCFACFQRCFVKVVPLALFHFFRNL